MNRTTLRGALLSDWGPAIETTIRGIAAVAVAVYTAGLMIGTWLHRLNDWMAHQWAARVIRSADPSTHPPDLSMPLALLPAAAAPIALLAPAPVPVDGLALALQLIAAGVSIRQAARKAGIPRTTLQRRLRYVIGIDPSGSGADESVTTVLDITTNPWQVRFHDARRSRD